jgi:misacylated tRNA(Ala) deacylase
MLQRFNFSNSLEILETNIADLKEYHDGILIQTFQSQLRTRFGGQLEDGGDVYLNGWNKIADIVILNTIPYFLFPDLKRKNFEVGAPILVRLDLLRRQRISVMHTSIHLLCALTGNEMSAGHAGIFKSRVDFLGDAEEFNSRLNLIKARFNECINANLSVSAIYLPWGEASHLGRVHDFKVEKHYQALRVINIDGIDIRACNGTHVDRTGLLHGVGFGLAEKLGPEKFKVNLLLTSDTRTDKD